MLFRLFNNIALIVCCFLGLCAAGITSFTASKANPINSGSSVVLTCVISPAEAMTWNSDAVNLADCDTVSCAKRDPETRYTYSTINGGTDVTMTINPVSLNDNNKVFKCKSLLEEEPYTLIVSSDDDSDVTVSHSEISHANTSPKLNRDTSTKNNIYWFEGNPPTFILISGGSVLMLTITICVISVFITVRRMNTLGTHHWIHNTPRTSLTA